MLAPICMLILAGFFYKIILICCFQGFVSAVIHMRSFVPAVYDVTVAIPKSSPAPTMLRLFRGQPSVVSHRGSGLSGVESFLYLCILLINL